jgi:hypothetical protein
MDDNKNKKEPATKSDVKNDVDSKDVKSKAPESSAGKTAEAASATQAWTEELPEPDEVSPASKGQIKVVASIDFGTSMSGWMWAELGYQKYVEYHSRDKLFPKEPTVAIFDTQTLKIVAIGETASKIALTNTTRYIELERFKMALYRKEKHLSIQLHDEKQTVIQFPYARALAAFYEHYKECVLADILQRKPDLKIKENHVEWMISMPCIWDQWGRNLALKAARFAGMTHTQLVLESEACSMVCADTKNLLQVGDKYVVLDIGGGTADTTIHKLSKERTLGEVVASGGGPWGSLDVEIKFHQWLEEKFGKSVLQTYIRTNYNDWKILQHRFCRSIKHKAKFYAASNVVDFLSLSLPTSFSEFFKDKLTELAKKAEPTVAPAQQTATAPSAPTKEDAAAPAPAPSPATSGGLFSYFWPFATTSTTAPPTTTATTAPNTPAPASTKTEETATTTTKKEEFEVTSKSIQFSHRFAQEVFFGTTLKAVDQHLNSIFAEPACKDLKFLYLCGGFANSPLLAYCITKQCEERKIVVRSPLNTASTVLQGAIMIGMSAIPVIRTRVANATLGVAVSQEWNSRKHEGRRKAYRPVGGLRIPYCDGIFSPFVLAGDEVAFDHQVTQTYTPGEDDQKLMVLKILSSPSRVVGYGDEDGVTQLSVITVKMPVARGGVERKVQVSFNFGAHILKVTARDLTSSEEAQLDVGVWYNDSR